MDRETFTENYTDIQRPLWAFLLAAAGNLHDADDLSQRVWQVLWKKRSQFEGNKGSFKSWAFGIAKLEVLKWRQEKARSREVLSEETMLELADTCADQAMSLAARHVFLLDCVGELEAVPRKVLDLKYSEGWLSREIGEKIDRSTEAVDMMLSRTRKALRDCVERKVLEAR